MAGQHRQQETVLGGDECQGLDSSLQRNAQHGTDLHRTGHVRVLLQPEGHTERSEDLRWTDGCETVHLAEITVRCTGVDRPFAEQKPATPLHRDLPAVDSPSGEGGEQAGEGPDRPLTASFAMAELRQTLADRAHVLGVMHPHTLASRDSLGLALDGMGEHAEAVRLHRQTVDDRIRVLGLKHPDTLTSRRNLADALARMGEQEEAVRLLRQTLADRVRVLGPEHLRRHCWPAGYRRAADRPAPGSAIPHRSR
ncbi:tetratricopeptide repeat protein [Streptomyces sp. NPDC051105]|uniref:tetratricopeptide repeat protein n=1 Tax=Streptomyces sp. NPDC051105 TaxID=3154843 RepID=UPI0034496898